MPLCARSRQRDCEQISQGLARSPLSMVLYCKYCTYNYFSGYILARYSGTVEYSRYAITALVSRQPKTASRDDLDLFVTTVGGMYHPGIIPYHISQSNHHAVLHQHKTRTRGTDFCLFASYSIWYGSVVTRTIRERGLHCQSTSIT